MKRVRLRHCGALFAGTLAVAGAAAAGSAPVHAADDGSVYIVQGLPGRTVSVAIDGKTVATDVAAAKVIGPFKVAGGERKVSVTGGGKSVEDMVKVKGGSAEDVVVHLPASPVGAPVMTVFNDDLSSVPKGKAALYVAHTAAVPPADIKVNGKVLFANVANGESLHLTVPAQTYAVSIVPTGESKPVILGPVSLQVKAGAVNRVYAVGNPKTKSMDVAVHVIGTSTDGSDAPSTVDTGTGGQAVGLSPWTTPAGTR